MILGIGTDVCDPDRIADAIDHQGDRFLARVFTPAEQSAAQSRPKPILYYARRFAAKEACAKALGTGITERVRWTDIEILDEPSGRPILTMTGGAGRRAKRLAAKGTTVHIHVSLACTANCATAVVVVETRPV